jgi:sugar O-acyltransferase (sialic acid O-acetyltransferase NeuD family)
MDNLIIIGAGGHGRVIFDIALSLNKYKTVSFLDDQKIGAKNVLGKVSDFSKFLSSHEFVVGIGDEKVREKIALMLKDSGAKIVSLVHEKAVIGSDVSIGNGTVVMAGAVINNGAKIGEGVIVNTCASIDHDSMVGDYTHVSVGARLAGTVVLEKRVFIGAGAVVINNVSIISDVVIGAGAVVVKNILEKGIYKGVPARKGE